MFGFQVQGYFDLCFTPLTEWGKNDVFCTLRTYATSINYKHWAAMPI